MTGLQEREHLGTLLLLWFDWSRLRYRVVKVTEQLDEVIHFLKGESVHASVSMYVILD